MTEQGSERQSSPSRSNPSDELSEANPRWLLVIGAVLLVAMLLVAAFALGVYLAERSLL